MRKRSRSSQRGAALVEFALMIVMLMLLVFVSIEVDRMMLVYSSLGDAARMGVRYAIVRSTSSSNAASVSTIQDTVKSFAIGLNTTDVTVNPCWCPTPGPSCTCSTTPGGPGSQVKVDVSYAYAPLIGYLGSIWGITLRASSSGIVVY